MWQWADGQEETQKEILIKKRGAGMLQPLVYQVKKQRPRLLTLGRLIRYPLAATALNRDQCKEIDKNLKKHVLGKLGVVRTATDQVAFAPPQIGGIGLHKTAIDQTINHVKMIMQHGHTDSITGKLIRNTTEQLSIETGIGGNPLKINLEKISYTCT